MEIIRNCSHHSCVHVAIVLDKDAMPVKIIKAAFNEEGAQSIKRELDGVTWYDKMLQSPDGSVISFDSYGNAFARLELRYRRGSTADPSQPLGKNYKKIRSALSHYVEVFRGQDCRYSHGDYSLDNILFNGDCAVWILDWENFNDKLPVEFDIVYCVMEACYFYYKRKRTLQRDEVSAAIDLLKYGLKNLSIEDSQIIKRPASYVRDLFLNNKDVFGLELAKYPLAVCPHEDILTLDTLFAKGIERW